MFDLKAKVKVQWFDGFQEEFECFRVTPGPVLLWMRLIDGDGRNIPLWQVRWFDIEWMETEVTPGKIGF